MNYFGSKKNYNLKPLGKNQYIEELTVHCSGSLDFSPIANMGKLWKLNSKVLLRSSEVYIDLGMW